MLNIYIILQKWFRKFTYFEEIINWVCSLVLVGAFRRAMIGSHSKMLIHTPAVPKGVLHEAPARSNINMRELVYNANKSNIS